MIKYVAMKVYLTERQIIEVLKLQENGYSKRHKKNLSLKEDAGVVSNIGMANGLQDARRKALDTFNKNPNVNGAAADAGKIDGQPDTSTGEGVKLQLPVNANSTQMSVAQNIVNKEQNDDVEIEFTRDTPGQKTGMGIGESVSFTKKELDAFLRSL